MPEKRTPAFFCLSLREENFRPKESGCLENYCCTLAVLAKVSSLPFGFYFKRRVGRNFKLLALSERLPLLCAWQQYFQFAFHDSHDFVLRGAEFEVASFYDADCRLTSL